MLITKPRPIHTATELPRVISETSSLFWQMYPMIQNAPKGDGHPVLVLPGYGAADGAMSSMRFFLDKIGYRSVRFNQGRNIETPEERIRSVDDASRFRARMVELINQRIDEVYAEHQQAMTVIGWSMGGCYALDVSQTRADKLRAVITLGSPFGDPRGTTTWDFFRWLNRSDVPVEAMNFDGWLNKTRRDNHKVPVHVLYSERDGIVSPTIAQLPEQPNIHHTPLDSSHVGFAFNPKAYSKIAEILHHA